MLELYEAALAADSSGRSDEALRLLSESAEQFPREPTWFWTMGLIYTNQSMLNEAILTFNHALGLDPNCIEALDGLAEAYTEQADLKRAQETIHQRLAIRRDAKPLLMLARLAAAEARFADAVELGLESLTLDENNTTAHYQVGVWASYLNDLEAAERHFRQCIASDPKFSQAYRELGFLQYGTGNNGTAIPLLERATELTPDIEEPHFYLALTFRAEGRMEDANRELSLALELCSKQSDIQYYRDTFESAPCLPGGA
jgi:tetratricopeptide (TPR) repeat protein